MNTPRFGFSKNHRVLLDTRGNHITPLFSGMIGKYTYYSIENLKLETRIPPWEIFFSIIQLDYIYSSYPLTSNYD